MRAPDVILLNGCSCSGKTSLTRALQAELPDAYMRMGLDDFMFEQAPQRWRGFTPEGINFHRNADGGYRVEFGEGAAAMLRAYHRCVRTCVEAGLKVVVDEVILAREHLSDWLEVLSGIDVFFIGVRCDFDELVRREHARLERTDGVVRGQFDQVHAHGLYDVEVDSTRTPTSALTDQVLAALAARAGPTAFERLAARR